MTFHLKIKDNTDAFTCRSTGFYVNCFKPEGKTPTISADIKTVVRSGRVLDLNGAVHQLLEAEEAERTGVAIAPQTPAAEEKQEAAPETAPVVPPAPEAPASEPKFEEPKEAPAVDFESLDKEGLLSFIEERDLDKEAIGVSVRMGEARIREALVAYLAQKEA